MTVPSRTVHVATITRRGDKLFHNRERMSRHHICCSSLPILRLWAQVHPDYGPSSVGLDELSEGPDVASPTVEAKVSRVRLSNNIQGREGQYECRRVVAQSCPRPPNIFRLDGRILIHAGSEATSRDPPNPSPVTDNSQQPLLPPDTQELSPPTDEDTTSDDDPIIYKDKRYRDTRETTNYGTRPRPSRVAEGQSCLPGRPGRHSGRSRSRRSSQARKVTDRISPNPRQGQGN